MGCGSSSSSASTGAAYAVSASSAAPPAAAAVSPASSNAPSAHAAASNDTAAPSPSPSPKPGTPNGDTTASGTPVGGPRVLVRDGSDRELLGGSGTPSNLPRKSITSKRLTLPATTNGATSVGTTTLNLSLVQTDVERHAASGSNSARGRVTPPGSARRRGDEAESEMLVSIPFFESLDKKSIQKLRNAFERRKFAAGEWISRASDETAARDPQQEAADGKSTADFFVIISGSVQLSVRVFTSKTMVKPPSSAKSVRPPPVAKLDPNVLPATETEDVTLAILKDGQWFGVEALVQDAFQRTDILALEDCVLLSISRAAFRTFAEGVPTMQTSIADTLTNTRVSLHSLPFFQNVDELKLQQLSSLLEFRRFQPGDVIVREGDPADGFFVIVSGSAKLTVNTRDNSTFLLSTLGERDFFGEQSITSNSPRVATVTATSKMLLLFLSATRFKRFARLAPEVFSEAFDKIVAQRTTQLLKTIPLFDVLCLERPARPESIPDESANGVVDHAANFKAQEDAQPQVVYDEAKLQLLATLFSYQTFAPNVRIFSEGERADSLYVIVRGSVEVSAEVETGRVVLNKLYSSDYFGEISLIFQSVRSASITTLEPTVCLVLAAQDFARFLSVAPQLKERLSFAIGPRVATIIENIPFFRNEIKENKPWSKLGLLGELCQFEKAEENEIIFRQNDPGDKFYVIISGAVLVTKDDSHQESRRLSGGLAPADATLVPSTHVRAPTILPGVILRRGNYFGDESLLSECKRWGTVTSLALSVFLTLSRANFEKYVKIAPELRDLILKRQQSSSVNPDDPGAGAGMTNITHGRSSSTTDSRLSNPSLLGAPAAILRVAANQSLEHSPIFSHADDHGDEFQPSLKVAAQHPNLHRLTTSVPMKSRQLHAATGLSVNRAASTMTTSSADALNGFKSHGASGASPSHQSNLPSGGVSPLDRPAPGRLPSLPAINGSPTAGSQPSLHRKPSLAPLTPLKQPLPTLSPVDAKRGSVLAKELQAYEMQNQPSPTQ